LFTWNIKVRYVFRAVHLDNNQLNVAKHIQTKPVLYYRTRIFVICITRQIFVGRLSEWRWGGRDI